MQTRKPLKTKYGKWTVIGAVVRTPKPGGGRDYKVLCRCQCKREFDVRVGDLRNGKSVNCRWCAGRAARPSMRRPPKPKAAYGEWTPLGPVRMQQTRSGRPRWFVRCRCSCGKERWVFWRTLSNGDSQSCGHGFIHTSEQKRLYQVWHAIKRRCYDEKAPNFAQYGGRGIAMCDEWRGNADAFIRWAEANGAKKGLLCDRKDNDGPYSPDNCRFVTPKESARNTRRTIYVTAFGETKPLPAWAEDARCEVKVGVLYSRIVVKRIPPELAITLPPKAGMPLEYRTKIRAPRHFG